MHTCYSCKIQLTKENCCEEHIILNAIGGRLKSRSLLCKKCNSEFGSQCDSELASQLSSLTSHLKVKKHRGKINIIKGGTTENGEYYDIVNGSKPVLAKPKYSKVEENGKVNINITARSEEEMREMLNGLAKDYPTFNVEDAISKATRKQYYLDKPLNFKENIGGTLAFRSITKTAINFYIYNNGESKFIEHLIPYLKGETQLEIGCHFNPDPTPYLESDGEVVHLLHIIGNNENKILYCYIHFFSVYSFLILLSNEYTGQNINKTYSYDVLENKEVDKIVNLNLSSDFINDAISKNIPTHSFEVIAKKLSRVMNIAIKRSSDQEIRNIMLDAFNKIVKQYPSERFFNKQMIGEISIEAGERLAKFWMSRNKIE